MSLLTFDRYFPVQSTAIDFSDGVEEADGTLCVFRPEQKNTVEQEQEQQCTRRTFIDIESIFCHSQPFVFVLDWQGLR